MQILSVDLENIKSYERAQVEFAPGTNAICGPNGAGKSTLIEAIGFALFGSQRVRQDQLIRAGAAHGRIEVSFVSSLDGRPFAVTRDLRRSGVSGITLYSLDLNAPICAGVREVQEQLIQHLGLKPGVKLASLFEGVVGVPQGQLTYDFLLSPTPRKARFEELLALQEFEVAHQRLAGPIQFGRTKIASAEGRLSALDEQVRTKDELAARLALLEAELAQVQEALRSREQQVQELRLRRASVDENEQALARAREKLGQAQSACELALQRLLDAKRRCNEARDAAAGAEVSSPGHDRYFKLDASARALEQDLNERGRLLQSQQHAQAALARLEATLEGEQLQLKQALAARQAARELEPRADRQASLEGVLTELQQRGAQRRELLLQRTRLQEAGQAHEMEMQSLRARQTELEKTPVEVERLAARCDTLRAEIASGDARIRLLQAEHEAQESAAAAIRSGERQSCPACRRPFEGGDVEGFMRHLSEQLHESQGALAGLLIELKRLHGELAQAEKRLKRANEFVSALRQAEAQVASLTERQASVAQDLRLIEKRLTPLTDLDARLQSATAELTALADPKSRLSLARSQAAEAQQLERAVTEHEAVRQRLSDEMAKLRAAVQPYDGIEERLATVRLERDARRGDYDTYRRLLPLSEELPTRRLELERQGRLADNAERAAVAARQTHEALAGAYDAAVHQALRERERQADIEVAQFRLRLGTVGERLEESRARLAELVAMERLCRELRAQIADGTAAVEALRFLRDAIRKAGPEIAKRIVSRVTRSANEIFAEIIGDYASELKWEADYGISLRRGPHTREFGQLSGGEQMMAALAVRLALLREMSDVGVAFFDEPTVNLDEERRRSLAEQIRLIRGFEQLFVISHDDSLEGVTDSVIRVYKEDGVSRVEQA